MTKGISPRLHYNQVMQGTLGSHDRMLQAASWWEPTPLPKITSKDYAPRLMSREDMKRSNDAWVRRANLRLGKRTEKRIVVWEKGKV